MFDLNRTLQLVSGALFDAEATWRSYLPEAGDWKKTAFLLTGPLIIASVVLGYLIGLMGSDASMFGQFRPTLVTSLFSIITGAIAAVVVAFIFSAFSGLFGGKSGFALGLAATTLAFVPGYLGQALTWLPWIGGLLALGLAIYALVLLWRIIPIYFEVPDSKRAAHYIVSLIATIAVFFILSTTVGRILYPQQAMSPFAGTSGFGSRDSGSDSGLFGGIARQAELYEAAENDTYTPPSDGKLTDRQVQEYIRVMDRVTEALADKEEQMREIAERAEKNEEMSLRDMSTMMSGMTQTAGMNTLEIEMVKGGGGNFAEHRWVKESLRTAWLQKDINDAVAHNYALFQEYEDQLSEYVQR